eukprot:gene6848-7617_t
MQCFTVARKLVANFEIGSKGKSKTRFQEEETAPQPGMLGFYGEEGNPNRASEHEKMDDISSATGSFGNQQLRATNFTTNSEEPAEGDTSTASEWDESLQGDQEPELNIPPGMGLCELCGYIGDKKNFYSKSKRFCRMECAKKFSACQKKKNTKGAVGKKFPARMSIPKRKSKLTGKSKKQRLMENLVDVSQELPTSSAQVAALSWIDQEFNWSDYLKSTGDKPAGDNFFKHTIKPPVLSEIHVGMKVEVVNCGNDVPKDAETAYWVATILDVKGNMMLLRYEGYENDGTDNFWFDVRSKHVHPVGWCYSVQKLLIPPVAIKNRRSNWQQYLFKKLSGARTFSNDFLERVQRGSYNKFEVGMKVEVGDRHNLVSMCVATIVDIAGDRLRLRYDGLDAESGDDFLCHYLSSEIHPVGWSSLVGHTLHPPTGWKQGMTEWNEFLAEDLQNSRDAPQECFVQESMGTPPSRYGQFEESFKFEAIDPLSPGNIVVATVVKMLRFNYFVAGIDGTSTYFICHSGSMTIFPINWCKSHKIQLTAPKEYNGRTFEWSRYLAKTHSKAAPSALFKQMQEKRVVPFQIGMKLEAVDLRESSFICPATVIEIRGSLLRIHFDGWDSTFDQWCDFESLDLFPVGWCEKNSHLLQPPGSQLPDSVLQNIRTRRGNFGQQMSLPATASAILPKSGNIVMHFNQNCSCGPYLNQEEVLNLPDLSKGALTGPPHQNGIRKVLHYIINAAIDPNLVLELFSKEFYQTKQHKDLKLDSVICLEITGKTGKRFLRRVRAPSKQSLVPKYFARVCSMLKCCPYFISDERFVDDVEDVAALPDSQTGEDLEDDMKPSTSRMPPPQFLDSPGGPSSSTQDRGFDPLNMLDEEFVRSKDPRTWNVTEVMDFLAAIGCQDHAMTFQKQEIDGKALLLLPSNALEALTENKLGPITKLMDALQSLKKMWGLHS